MKDFNSDYFLPGGLNVYSWDKELPHNKAVLPDTGLPHPSPALEYIFIMLIFAVIIQHLQCSQSCTELFRTAKGWFESQSKQAGSLSPFSPPFSFYRLAWCWSPLLPSPVGWGGVDRTEALWGTTPESQGIYSWPPWWGWQHCSGRALVLFSPNLWCWSRIRSQLAEVLPLPLSKCAWVIRCLLRHRR